jgi:hypothetical protein
LFAASAASSNDVWAVGVMETAHGAHSLTVHYNGHRWVRVPSPNIGWLNGVAAVAPDDVWAIAPNDGLNGILHWNGTRWTVQRLPRLRNLQPQSISASGPRNVWVVGWRAGANLGNNSLGNQTLALHWTGGPRWQIVPSPNPVHTYNEFSAVVTSSPTDAWAAGTAEGRCFTAHWQGARWQTVPVPRLNGRNCRDLTGLGSAGPDRLWAVGSGQGPGFGGAYYLRWTGQTWKRIPGPNNPNTPTPSAISGTNPADTWSVGCATCSGSIIGHQVGHHWRNVGWSVTGYIHHALELDSVVTFSTTDAWSVGCAFGTNPNDSDNQRALLMHWNGKNWQPEQITHLPSAGFN